MSASSSRLSIQQRLTLLICVLLLCVIAGFSCMSYLGVRKAALATGRERLSTLTVQLGSMFQQSVHTLTAATAVAANQEAIKNYLQSGDTSLRAAALAVLEAQRKDTSFVEVELFNADRKGLLCSAKTGVQVSIRPATEMAAAGRGPDFTAVGKIYTEGDSMYYPVVAAVTDNHKPIGWLVKWRQVHATPKTLEQLSQLIGTHATLYFGNDDGKLWTDMIKPVAAPPVDRKSMLTTAEYTRNGEIVMGALRPVPNTHWLILIEFPLQTMLETANRFLYWLLVIGVVLVIAGMLAAWLMSRNITGPLNRLTAATSAIAAGDYTPLVQTGRNDELGKLARSFNSMTQQIRNAQQELEEKVRRRTAQLESVNRELEAFSYSVSHDLRAPLRIISGYSTLLKEDHGGKLDEDGRRMLGAVINNAKMMGQLIDDLIDFSRMERKELTNEPVNMQSLAESSLQELLQNGQASRYHVQVDELPACRGDASMLKQVWLNLIGNAIKYSSKERQPDIKIGARDQGATNIYFVRDNGVGFDMQYAHKLFGVFQRLHRQDEFEGTGVGLALVKRIIDKHAGEIWVEAAPGEGATFYFRLRG